jgi:inner membrane protein
MVGAALALPALPCRPVTALLPRWIVPVSAGLLATIPDLDLAARRLFGIRAASDFSHRGFFHSPFFLILAAAVLAAMVARKASRDAFVWLWLLWAGCMITHPLMDAMTDGGRGVMLGVPFSAARVYLPWRPIRTPSGREPILRRALELRRSELPFCAAALLLGLSGLWLVRKTQNEPRP